MNKKKKLLLLVCYFGLPFSAALLYLRVNPYLLSTPVLGISIVTGIFAFSFLLFQFLLSARIPAIERGIGHDRIMRFHRIMAMVSVFLLLPHMVTKLLIFPTSLQTFIGLLALVGFVGTAVFSSLFFRPSASSKLSYEKVKLLHNGTFILTTLVAAHAALSSAGAGFLGVYFIVVFAAGMGGYLYRKLISPIRLRRTPWVVTEVRCPAEEHTEILMHSPVGARFSPVRHRRLPGQFAYFSFLGQRPGREEHPFTVSNSSDFDVVRVTVKKIGDFTSRLEEVKVGDPVAVEGPFGTFSYRCFEDAVDRPIVFIAGGIGITPFLAMSEDLRDKAAALRPPSLRLIWGTAKEEFFVHRDFFTSLAEEWEDFSFSCRVGYIDAELLESELSKEEIAGGYIFLCGPPVMMKAVEDLLKGMGVDRKRIVSERFSV
jgi:predicted ferric reductase